MRILIHGFGSYACFFYEAIKKSKDKIIDWSIILPTSHYKEQFSTLLGTNKVYYLFDYYYLYKNNVLDSSYDILDNYNGNIFLDIECDKKTIKHKDSYKQEDNAVYTYLAYKKVLEIEKPEYIIFPHIESHEGKILFSLAKELGICPLVVTHSRMLGGSFFSKEVTEDIPKYSHIDDNNRKKAREILDDFLNHDRLAYSYPIELEKCKGNVDAVFRRNVFERIWLYFQQTKKEWINQSFDGVRYRILNNLPMIRNFIWKSRTVFNSRYCHYKKIEDLPKNFIYYPLQYSPESSINTPAPFFVDQLRIIDILRFSMPSNYILVVKEHPSCIMIRNNNFVKTLMKKAGVKVAYYGIESKEIIKRAAVTVSVTGTANYEAFLQGHPAIIFGGTFFADALGGICGINIDEVRKRISKALKRKITYEERIESIARVVDVSYPFIIGTPGDGTIVGDITMSETNIINFLKGLENHINRIKVYEQKYGGFGL